MIRILIVDDEASVLRVCARALRGLPDAEVLTENQSARAAERLAAEAFDLLITDLRMPEVDGVALLRVAREHNAELPVIMLTGYPTLETAVEGVRYGAADYLMKPIRPRELRAVVERVLGRAGPARPPSEDKSGTEIITESLAMTRVLETADRLAETGVDILLIGETGTGKELVARRIHESSGCKGPFVAVNCGAIPENLLESELFGHEKGAFTGADQARTGLLEQAHRGVFFLDEILSMPLSLQVKLLRVLQERKLRRLGGAAELSVELTVIAAAQHDPIKDVKEGGFRDDLYYRIEVGRLELPPLRQRDGDVRVLAQHFMERYAREMKRPALSFSPEALAKLEAYRWPGNIRELQNMVRRALINARGEVLKAADLPMKLAAAPTSSTTELRLLRQQKRATFERPYLVELLTRNRGEVKRSAKEAGVSRGTFYQLMKTHKLDPKDFRKKP